MKRVEQSAERWWLGATSLDTCWPVRGEESEGDEPIVVTGTDTRIGKAVFSAGLAGLLGANYWKPIQAGLEGETDREVVARLGGLSADRIAPEIYRLRTRVRRIIRPNSMESASTRIRSRCRTPGDGLWLSSALAG